MRFKIQTVIIIFLFSLQEGCFSNVDIDGPHVISHMDSYERFRSILYLKLINQYEHDLDFNLILILTQETALPFIDDWHYCYNQVYYYSDGVDYCEKALIYTLDGNSNRDLYFNYLYITTTVCKLERAFFLDETRPLEGELDLCFTGYNRDIQ